MKRLLTGLLALCLFCGLPVSAAGNANPSLSYRESGGGVHLTLEGVDERIYAVQLELVLEGNCGDVRFSPAGEGVYSPDCHVEPGQGTTAVTIYMVADEQLLSGGSLGLGTLTAEGSFGMPGQAELLLLDWNMEPIGGGAKQVPLTRIRDTGGASSGGGGSSGIVNKPAAAEKTYTVQAASSEHGSVSVRPAKAKEKDTVTLTVSPDAGYVLESLVVKDQQGREILLKQAGENRYTFSMPAGEVVISASFVPEKAPETVSMAFQDVVSGDWCYDAVRYVFEKGLMNGTSATTFTPNAPTTRGMIVAILYRLEGSPAAGLSQFSDVGSGAYYASAVSWASANGIVNGYGDGTFRPGNPITREQMAAFLYRYAVYKNRAGSARADLSAFADAGQIASYAVEPLRWANAAGLINGVTANTLSPAGNATRAQVAVILSRFAQNVL